MDKSLIKMIFRRIIQSMIVIWLVTLIVFLLIKMIPGDPIKNFLGSEATEEQIQYYTKLYGYDKPVLIQYFNWFFGLFQGKMGFSIFYQSEISAIILPRLAVTLNIILFAFVLAVVVGVTLGTIAALNRGKAIDSIITLFANIGVSMPTFWFGILLIYVFALHLKWLPTSQYVRMSDDMLGWFKHIIMPVIVVAGGPMATFTRQTRSSVLEVARQEYVSTAKSKGIKRIQIIMKHQLRNALIPIVTVMGSRLGGMLGSTVLVESVFVIPGLGSQMITAIRNRDFMSVANGVMLIAAFVALCNLVVDILYGIIDPRIRNK